MENYRFFFPMFSQISRTPDFERSFRVKRCSLYACVYANSFMSDWCLPGSYVVVQLIIFILGSIFIFLCFCVW